MRGERGKTLVFLLLGLLCILHLAVLIVFYLRQGGASGEVGTRTEVRRNEGLRRTEAAGEELRTLREQIDGMESVDIDKLLEVQAALDRIHDAFVENDALSELLDHQDYVANSGGQIASQNLSAAQVVIAGLSIAFTVVLFGVTILTALSIHSYREEAGKLERSGRILFRAGRRAARNAEVHLQKAKNEALGEVEDCKRQNAELAKAQQEISSDLKRRLELQTANESRAREYLDTIAKIHGSAFSELLAALPSEFASSDVMNHLRNKGLELQARMDLMAHHDQDRQWNAISMLAAVGTRVAIPDLIRLKDDPTVERKILEHAIEAIRQIRARTE